ncbi:hypothetical protein [Nonlabens sp.]|uniref:hypothetical protein n=1 Tax=Nonlabens sp. TaxID=1888209 RepID=UPI0025D1454F|nr:hypothetical protein [Nonlabens sp.]
MKNSLLKNTFYSLITLFLLSATSCEGDDDLPSGPTIVVNTFFYGPEPVNSFESTAAYYNDVVEVRSEVYRTAAFVTDENLTLDVNSEFQGLGVLLDVVLYGNQETALQTGTYTINADQNSGNAYVAYDIDYDSNNSLNRPLPLVSGYVSVTPYQTGYAIEIDGEDLNGDRFHGIYLGDLILL